MMSLHKFWDLAVKLSIFWSPCSIDIFPFQDMFLGEVPNRYSTKSMVMHLVSPTNLRFPQHYLNKNISTVSQLTFSTKNGSFENEKSEIPTASWWWLRWWWRQLGPAGTLMISRKQIYFKKKRWVVFLCSNFLGYIFCWFVSILVVCICSIRTIFVRIVSVLLGLQTAPARW